MTTATVVDRTKWRGGARRRLLIGASVVLVAGGLLASHGGTCYALAAEAYQSVTDSYLVMWIERTGTALGCF